MTRIVGAVAPWVWIAGLAAVVIAIDLGSIAACGPWDPWETHYGEVARQILARRDPLDLWWQPGYGPDGQAERAFWSKPALPFWLMALCMWILGVGTGAAADEMVRSPWPELAIRLPSLVAGLVTAAFLGYVVHRLVLAGPEGQDRGRRARLAGVGTALVLATMPQWAIVTRQALTDMFFAGPVVIAVGAWALATLQPDRPLRRRPLPWPRALARRGLTIAWDRAHLGFVLVFVPCVLAQIAVLPAHVLGAAAPAHVARLVQRPGPPGPHTLHQIHLSMLIYWGLSAVALILSLGFRARSHCWMAILYLQAGLSLLGKGMIGPGLIGLLVVLHALLCGRARLLWRGAWIGAVLFCLVVLPWHHAMYLYRGDRWFNELIVINNLARFGTGEQEQAVGGFIFYVQTLGLAALPWVAALPAALWDCARRAFPASGTAWEEPPATRELRRLALLWLVASLALITYSVTKYYHYLLPVLPPLAVIVGLWLAGLGTGEARRDARRPAAWACALVGAGLLAMIARDALHSPAWLAHLTTYLYTGMWRDGAPEVWPLLWLSAPFGLGLLCWALGRARLALALLVSSGLGTGAYVIDDYLPAASENWSQRSALRVYFDERGPDDRLASWWFYYRGETFFTKADVWVLKERDRRKLHAFIDEHRGAGVTLWVMTTRAHGRRLKSSLPGDMRGGVELVYENFHYSLLRAPIP